ncbi:MAG: hypothetical protein HC881_20860 [Leptolyngbyaceae cyanobacterium SL_7_1]|nr:hypothetical protein [Leptolyngbyaceae cyanobacterium SL_7_1]
MTSDSTRPLLSPFQTHAELSLLQLILQDSAPYPWNPAESETDAYFADLEGELVNAGWAADEWVAEGNALAAVLDQAWSRVSRSGRTTNSTTVSHDLFQRFVTQVPHVFLEGIAQRARQVVSSNVELADKLVACVIDLLPEWGEEDLQVLARHFAYDMRGADTEMLEVALRSVRCAAWTELSGIEQARLSLAIARYTIAQMPIEPIEPR